MKHRTWLIIGKCLVMLGLLWPVPCGLFLNGVLSTISHDSSLWQDPVTSAILQYMYNIPMWGTEHGYWWPAFGIIVIGMIICALSSMNVNQHKSIRYMQTPVPLLFWVIKWGLILVVFLYAIVALVIGVIYAIGHIDRTGPFFIGAIVFTLLIGLGICFFNKDKL